MAPILLKIKGNKSFSPFSNLDSEEELSRTWRVCTKVKDSLENGSRLENLSWRLWFLHHLMVDGNKNKTQFKKLSLATTKKLETEKGTALSQLPAPPNFNFASKPVSSTPVASGLVASVGGAGQVTSEKKQSKKKAKKLPALNLPTPSEQHPSKLVSKQYQQHSGNQSASAHPTPVSEQPKQQLQQQQLVNLQQQQQQQQQQYQQQQQQQQLAAPLHTPPLHTPTPSSIATPFEHPYVPFQSTAANRFTLHQYTSDQSDNQIIELEDIFPYVTQAYLDPDNQLPVVEIFDDMLWSPISSAAPSPPYSGSDQVNPNDNPYFFGSNNLLYGNIDTPMTGNSSETSPTHSSPLQYPPQSQARSTHPAFENAMYVSTSVPPPPPTTMRNRLQPTVPGGVLSYGDSYSHSTTSQTTSNFYQALSVPTTPAQKSHQLTTSPDSESGLPPTTFNLGPTPAPLPRNVKEEVRPTTCLPSSTSSKPNPPKASSSSSCQIEASPPTGQKSICSNCQATQTPLWRRSATDELLCNACGLYLKLHNAPRPKTLKPHIIRKDARNGEGGEIEQPQCSNCGTGTTPLWRRDEAGRALCNACGLYLKLHHEKRPISMKTDVIKKRQRYEGSSGAAGAAVGSGAVVQGSGVIGGTGKKPHNKKTKLEHDASVTSSPTTQFPPSTGVTSSSMAATTSATIPRDYCSSQITSDGEMGYGTVQSAQSAIGYMD